MEDYLIGKKVTVCTDIDKSWLNLLWGGDHKRTGIVRIVDVDSGFIGLSHPHETEASIFISLKNIYEIILFVKLDGGEGGAKLVVFPGGKNTKQENWSPE